MKHIVKRLTDLTERTSHECLANVARRYVREILANSEQISPEILATLATVAYTFFQ